MLSVYLIVGIVCAILLLVMAALGDFDTDADVGADVDFDVDADAGVGHGDFGGAGISPLSIPILLVFGTCFGSLGAILDALEWHYLVVPAVAVGFSAIVTVITFVIMVKIFVATQGSTAVGLNDLVGLEGLVSIRIGKDEPGQVMVVTEQRGRITSSAIAEHDIPTNSQIKVIRVVGNSVMVEKITKEV
jgi:membrane-bound ClpP family serine protease